MEIKVADLQKRKKTAPEKIAAKAEKILDALGCRDGELSLVLVDDDQMRELNRQYRGRDEPTNVLAFAMQEGEFGGVTPGLLGDVVISVETAAREATEAGMTLESRLTRLLVHGILHLLGFDHEKDDAEAAAMEKRSQEILALLGEG